MERQATAEAGAARAALEAQDMKVAKLKQQLGVSRLALRECKAAETAARRDLTDEDGKLRVAEGTICRAHAEYGEQLGREKQMTGETVAQAEWVTAAASAKERLVDRLSMHGRAEAAAAVHTVYVFSVRSACTSQK